MFLRFLSPKARAATLAGLATIAASALAQDTPPAAHNDVLIKNAVMMTATHGDIKNGSVYIKDGKIAAVGEDVQVPEGAAVIDAGGKSVTPGIIDSHSHIALDNDINEATSPGHTADDDDGRLRLSGQGDLPGAGGRGAHTSLFAAQGRPT